MQGTVRITLTVAAALALVAGVAVSGENVWVSSDGSEHQLQHGAHHVFLDDGEAFDLSELADGETRVFGEGDRQVTVTRNGDVATISRPERGEASEIEITCSLGQDTCKIMTADDDPERVVIMIKKTSECVNGEGDCDVAISDLNLGDDAHTIVIRKHVECDDEGNCNEFEDVTSNAEAHGHATIHVESAGLGEDGVVMIGEGGTWTGSSGHGDMVFITKSDDVTLRCPEGDATIHVKKDEAEDVFLCPKHSVAMEKVKAPSRVHEIKIKKKEKSQDD